MITQFHSFPSAERKRLCGVSPQLKRDLKTDVLIVGAGISGALIAFALARDGHRVAVVDRSGPLMGSTPASTSLLLFEIDTPLIHLKRKIGARPAECAWLRSKGALENPCGDNSFILGNWLCCKRTPQRHH